MSKPAENHNERVFRHMVAATPCSSLRADADMEETYAQLGMPTAATLSRGDVLRHLAARIAELLTPTGPSDSGDLLELNRVERHLAIISVADSIDVSDARGVLAVLRQSTCERGMRVVAFSQRARWFAAIRAARDYRAAWPENGPSTSIDPRHFAVALALRQLREEGFKARVVDGKVTFPRGEEERLASAIRDKIVGLGGVEVAMAVFDRLRGQFHKQQSRYHIARVTNSRGLVREPSVPFAWLLSLCVANTGPSSAEPTNEEVNAILLLARAFAAAYDLEPQTNWELLFPDRSTIVTFLQELVLYDGMFALVQSRPSDVVRTLEGLFDWVDENVAVATLGASLAVVTRIVSAVVDLVTEEPGTTIISRGAIARGVPDVDGRSVDEVMRRLTHDPAAVNRGLLLPHDQSRATFWKRPLIRDGGDFLCLDASWVSPSFFEAIADALRGSVNVDLGGAFERFVRAELARKGVTAICGKYRHGGVDGECDLVVETDAHVIFFELKTKVLSRTARSGHTLPMLVDLARSLLRAQVQLGAHELALYRHGELTLHDAETVFRLERRGRSVERVAMTLLDFGALHDRQVVVRILQLLTGSRIESSGPDTAGLTDLQRVADQLAVQFTALEALRPHQGEAFSNCRSLALGHLQVLLDDVSSNASFHEALFRTRHVTTCSLDFYVEHALASNRVSPFAEFAQKSNSTLILDSAWR